VHEALPFLRAIKGIYLNYINLSATHKDIGKKGRGKKKKQV
jgi:hypothetical protein